MLRIMDGYADPDVLVATDWVKAHLDQPQIKLVEVDLDTKAYQAGHIPGAIALNWQTQLQDPIRRDTVGHKDFEKLLGGAGVSPDDTVVFYGDHGNWFAAFGLWLFKYYGHRDARIMNGGRSKWLNEPDMPITTQETEVQPVSYRITSIEESVRASVADVLAAVENRNSNLVDVRTYEEYTGKITAPIGLTETAQRGGHVPGAISVPWRLAINQDGTFKAATELRTIYFADRGLDPGKETIVYGRIGERCSHSWWVLKHLLGLTRVKNYYGSWTEYGNLVGMPIEKHI